MIIYKILTDDQWRNLEQLGEIPGAPVDIADGFVHFSTADQVAETLSKHFAGLSGLWLLTYDTVAMDALKWEPSRGGALFPHLYAPLSTEGLIDAISLQPGPDGHVLPEDLA